MSKKTREYKKKRDFLISFRVSPTENTDFEMAVNQSNVSKSHFLRTALKNQILKTNEGK